MTTFVTKSELTSLAARLDNRFEKIDARFDKMEARFDQVMTLLSDFANSVSKKFAAIDHRFDSIDITLARHETIMENLREHDETTDIIIDGFTGRIQGFDLELSAVKSKLNRIAS